MRWMPSQLVAIVAMSVALASCASRELSDDASCGPSVADYCAERGCPIVGPTSYTDVATWCARASREYASGLGGGSSCGPYVVLEISRTEGNEYLWYANGSLVAVMSPGTFGKCVAGTTVESCEMVGVGIQCPKADAGTD